MNQRIIALFSTLLITLNTLFATPVLALSTPTTVQTYVSNQKNASISFYYENLVTGEKFSNSNEKVYSAASTIKLPLALYIYQLASDKKLDLDKKLTYKKHHYYEGTGVIRYQKVGTQYTIRDLVKKSMVHSDNIAFIMLKEHVGSGNFIQFMKSIGGKVTYPNGKNLTTAEDLAIYAKKVYQFKEKQPLLGGELLDFLTHTDYQDTIPGGTSKTEVAHKVGYLPRQLVFHDAGIVFDEEPYILVVMTKGIPYVKERKSIAQLSQFIHDHHRLLVEARKPKWTDVFVTINGQTQQFETKPIMKKGVTWVPIRELVGQLGGEVHWEADTRSINIQREYVDLRISLDGSQLWVNDRLEELKDPLFVRDGVSMIPLRFLANRLGFGVKWKSDTLTAEISLPVQTKLPMDQTVGELTFLGKESINGNAGE